MSFWSEERVAKLRQLAPTHSAGRIADILGCTRNAVIGKTARDRISLGKAAPVQVERPKPQPVAEAVPRPTPPVRAPIPVVEPPPAVPDRDPDVEPVEFRDLGENGCRWPIGDPLTPAFRFCGAAKADKRYCAHHARRSAA